MEQRRGLVVFGAVEIGEESGEFAFRSLRVVPGRAHGGEEKKRGGREGGGKSVEGKIEENRNEKVREKWVTKYKKIRFFDTEQEMVSKMGKRVS